MTAPSSAVVRTEGLTKRYGRITAVDGVGLEIAPGELFGFLGPNGAGKTTTIRMLLGLVHPSAGTVELLGRRLPRGLADALADVGALVEGPGFYPYLSGRRNLELFDAAGRGGPARTRRDRIEEALGAVGMAGVDRRPVKQYSLGMRQRLGLAAALLRHPRLLILDEPTNGLDPNGIRELRELFVRLARSGTTVVLSSHQLSEVELICTRAAVMVGGRVVAQDWVDRLLAPTGVVRISTPDPDLAVATVTRLGRPRVLGRGGELVQVALDGLPSELLTSELVHDGVRVRELALERRTLEDVFVGLTGGASADHAPGAGDPG